MIIGVGVLYYRPMVQPNSVNLQIILSQRQRPSSSSVTYAPSQGKHLPFGCGGLNVIFVMCRILYTTAFIGL